MSRVLAGFPLPYVALWSWPGTWLRADGSSLRRAEVPKDLGPDPGTRSPAEAPSATVALWLVGLGRAETGYGSFA